MQVDVWADDSDEGESDEDEEDDANIPADPTDNVLSQAEQGQIPPDEQPAKAEPDLEVASVPAPAAIQWGFDVDEDDDEED